MACSEARHEQIAALAGGRIDAGQAAELLTHIGSCSICGAEFDLVADLMHAPAVRPLQARVRAWPLLAAAAVAIAALWFWQPWSHRAPTLRELAQITPVQAPESHVRGNIARAVEYERAIDAYRAADFATAANNLDLVVALAPRDALVNLYLGISRLQLGTPALALTPLRVAADHGDGLVAERGLWFLANAHLLLEDAAPARAVLRRLRDLEGDYAPNAANLLAAIGDR